MRKWMRLTGMIAVLFVILVFIGTYSTAHAEEGDAAEAAKVTMQDSDLGKVDWFEKMRDGGNTMIALSLLSVAMVAFALERMIRMKASAFAPAGLAKDILVNHGIEDTEAIAAKCDKQPSTLSEIIKFLIHHRNNDMSTLSEAAGDIASREVRLHLQRIQPLAAIAGIAPLLGLLGTIIGMVEAFQLVSVYGDAGGASILADSISKALITTAAGLIIAIPALTLYHYLKHRLMTYAYLLEEATDTVISSWFLKGNQEQ